MTFAQRLKELRKEHDMTMDEVGSHIGAGRALIYKYEHGIVTNVPPDKVHKLANLFGVTRPYMMGWTDERNVNPSENLDVVAEKLRHPEGEQHTGEKWKPALASDCITAAMQALRALAKFKVSRTPIYPQQVLQGSSIASIVTFDNPGESHMNDEEIAVSTTKTMRDGSQHYVFAVNRNAPIGELSLMLSICIGHIYLGHPGNPHECARRKESECFAIHFRYPRPMIRLLQERGFVFTKESFSRIFGYCDPCMDSILNAPHVSTSPELNRLVKEQFVPYVHLLEELGLLENEKGSESGPLDLSNYMAGYED